jgi:hypothetical protein
LNLVANPDHRNPLPDATVARDLLLLFVQTGCRARVSVGTLEVRFGGSARWDIERGVRLLGDGRRGREWPELAGI